HTAGRPYERMAKLQTGTPLVLKLLAAVPGGATEEAELHQRFTALRERGEWFLAAPELLAFIEGARWFLRDQQPAPPTEEETTSALFGLTVEQLDGLVELVRASVILAEIEDFGEGAWHSYDLRDLDTLLRKLDRALDDDTGLRFRREPM